MLGGCPLLPNATFIFTNTMEADPSISGNYKVTSIQFRGPMDEGFGANELGENETIDPGDSKIFFLDTQGNPGNWTVKIQYNLYVLVTMTSLPAEREISEVTARQKYTWNWSVF
jgi:hypothetical protein